MRYVSIPHRDAAEASWIAASYGKTYAPNTRETVRRQTMHQFVQANLALYNPDAPLRPVNSPRAVYQVSPYALALLRQYGTVVYFGFTCLCLLLAALPVAAGAYTLSLAPAIACLKEQLPPNLWSKLTPRTMHLV